MRTQTLARPALCMRLFALIVVSGLFFAAGPARADAIDLGEAGNYNVFVFNDFTSYNSDTQGSLAAGGNVSLQNYGVGSNLGDSFSGSSVLVGGNLFYRNGQVKTGNVTVGGTADLNQSVGTGSSATVSGGVSGVSQSFDSAKQQLTQLSQNLSQLSANGNAQLVYSTLRLTGNESSNIQVFNIDASDLANASGWALDTSIPSDSYIIFNITGDNISWQNQGLQALSDYSDRIIYNFIDATLISLSGISVQGSILAPNARVVGNNGNLEGTLIANSFEGTLEFHNNQFISQEGGGEGGGGAVPEPGTLLLLGPALGGMFWFGRRKRRAQAAA